MSSIIIKQAVDGFIASVLPTMLIGMSQAMHKEMGSFSQGDWVELMSFFTGDPTIRSTRKRVWDLVGSGQLSAEAATAIDRLLSQQQQDRTVTLEDFKRATQSPDLTVDDLLAWLDNQPSNPHRQRCKSFLLSQPRQSKVDPGLVREVTRPMLRSANP